MLTGPKPIPLPAWAGPAGALSSAGIGGYWLGGQIYPYIAQPLGDAIDYVCRNGDSAETCDEEWEKAYEKCVEEIGDPNRGLTGGYSDIYSCARGLVSERCGGNRVEY